MIKTFIEWLFALIVVAALITIFGWYILGIAILAVIIVLIAPAHKTKQNKKL